MRIRTMLGAALLAAAVVVGFAGSPASARPVREAPATLKIGGTQYRTSAITAGMGHLNMSNGTVALTADAQRSLSAADFAELSRFVADANAANGTLTASAQTAANDCYKKVRVSTNANGIHVHLPACMLKNTALVLAGVAAIVTAAGNIDEISDKLAKAIGAAIVADAAALVAWSAVCSVFGNGDVSVNLTWQLVPYPGCG